MACLIKTTNNLLLNDDNYYTAILFIEKSKSYIDFVKLHKFHLCISKFLWSPLLMLVVHSWFYKVTPEINVWDFPFVQNVFFNYLAQKYITRISN